MIILLLLLFFFCNIQSAGFAGNTLLLINNGQVPFEKIDYNALIQLNEDHVQPMLFINKQSVNKIVRIIIADEQIICHKKTTVLVHK